jgi:hypothetical protein
MPFDMTILETRIRKLEEVRRMLSDPEIVQLLAEAFEAEGNTPPASNVRLEPQATGNDEADLVIREVMQSTAAEVPAAADAYWSRPKKT